MRASRAALLATLLLPLAFACSGGDSGGVTNPGGNTGGNNGGNTQNETTQNIEVTNPFLAASTGETAVSSAMMVEIRRIRITVYNASTNAILFQKTYDVDPTQSKWTLAFQAPLGVSIKLVTELMSVTAGVETVERSGQAGPLTLQACTTNCTPIPIQSYPGPVGNLSATSVTLSSKTVSVAEGQTTQLTATVLPASGSYQPVWSSLATNIATVSSSGVVAGVLPGTAKVVVAVGPRADTATITVTSVAKSIAVNSGNNQTAVVGSTLALPISVVVKDGAGNGVGNVAVTFEVTSGGGTLTGATQTTNSSGVATLGSWKLGTTVGAQTLTARAGTLSTTITASATAATSTCANIAYTIGSTVNGSWTSTDCLATSGSGRHYDMYEFTLPQQGNFKVSLSGPNGRRINTRVSGTQGYVQVMPSEAFLPSTTNPLELMYVLAPGSYVFEVASPDATLNQSYTLTTSVDTSTPCSPVTFITTGVAINGQLGAGDCAFGGGIEDRFILLPDSGQRLEINANSNAFPVGLTFRDDRLGPASPTLAFDRRNAAGQPVHVGYTTTFSDFTEIIVGSGATANGAYTLSVGTSNPANTCASNNPMAIGGSTMAVWDAADCAGGGRVWDRYPFALTSATPVSVSMTGNAADKAAGIFTPTGTEILDWSTTASATLNAVWFLGAGSYELRSSAPAASAGTTYTMTTGTANGSIGCSNNSATSGYSFTNQTLGGSDCTFNQRFEDRLAVYVQAGRTMSISMTPSDNNAGSVIIRDPATPAGTVIRIQQGTPGSTVSTSFTATTTGYYQFIFTTRDQNVSMSYSGTVTY